MAEQDILGTLARRQVLFQLLKKEYTCEPVNEAGIKLCDEQIAILDKQITDVILNGTGDKNKQPVGILHLE